MNAPERIWASWPSSTGCGLAFKTPSNPKLKLQGEMVARTPYILATPEALAAAPEVQRLIAEAVAREREAAISIARRFVDTITGDDIAAAIRNRKETT